MSYIEVTGKTEEEALNRALAQLGLERDDVSVEILERSKSGFLGIGAVPAKIRVSYGEGIESNWKEILKTELTPKTAPKAPRSAAPKAEAPKTESAPKAEPVKAAEAPKAAPQRESRPAPEKQRQRPQRQEKREEVREEVRETAAPAEPEELGEICTDEKAQQIETFLTGLLRQMGSDAETRIYQPEKGRYKVILEGEKLGALIGHRGETLDAIQQLTNYAVNRGAGSRVRIHLDAENYRQKREQSLQRLAVKVAGKVTKYRRNVTLEPMNAYERHVIHTALQDVPNVTTYSTGTEPNRRVIVAYERSR